MNSHDKRDQTYEVWSDTRHCTNKKLVFWHKFHLSYAKLAQFLCLPGFLCLSPPSGCEPALLQLWWRWTQTYQTSALSEEKHRCFMFCMRITPVDCQRKVCGLINTIITLTENMSCMAMIALWCIAISENGAEWLLWLRLCIEVQWKTTDEKKEKDIDDLIKQTWCLYLGYELNEHRHSLQSLYQMLKDSAPPLRKSISWRWICLLFIILSIQYHIRIFSFCLILDSLVFPQSMKLSER